LVYGKESDSVPTNQSQGEVCLKLLLDFAFLVEDTDEACMLLLFISIFKVEAMPQITVVLRGSSDNKPQYKKVDNERWRIWGIVVRKSLDSQGYDTVLSC
jgi:hypothetical protein